MNEVLNKNLETEYDQTLIEDRLLSEADHLNSWRNVDGSHSQFALKAVNENLTPAVKEASMPYAVSTTHQPLIDGEYMWLDQTSVEVARTGYKFHRHEAAIMRVGVEEDEAIDVRDNLTPGRIKVLISPKMSGKDAPREIAEKEHLAEDDAIRIHGLDIEENGQVRGKFMQSILVSDIPLSGWVRMLKDPNNIFGKSITLDDEESALSVMKVHKELELSEDKLPNGILSVVEALLPYLDKEDRQKVEQHIVLFNCDQDSLHKIAENITYRWLTFETDLADSLDSGYANKEVEKFIRQLSFEWGEDELALLEEHLTPSGGFIMDRKLAAILESARRNTLWSASAVITNNEKIVSQLSESAREQIHDNEMAIQTMINNGNDYREIAAVEIKNNQIIAKEKIEVGGGCPGEALNVFGNKKDSSEASTPENGTNSPEDSSDREKWKKKKAECVVKGCPSRPGKVEVGPCGVCMGYCQKIYDEGGDPNKINLITIFNMATSVEPKNKDKQVKNFSLGNGIIRQPTQGQ
jgi:hypothetical protein